MVVNIRHMISTKFKQFEIRLAFLILLLAMLACRLPIPQQVTPEPVPIEKMTLQEKLNLLHKIETLEPAKIEDAKAELGIVRDLMLEAKSRFGATIDQYDQQRIVVQAQFEQGKQSLLSFKDLVKEAQDKHPEFQKVYSEWRKVEQQIDALDEKLTHLEQMSNQFYNAAKEYAGTINDEQLKTSIIQKLDDSRTRYLARLEQAKISVSSLHQAKIKVDDTMKALEISYSLEIAETQMDEVFTEIDRLVELVMADLEVLSQESRGLLESFNNASTQ